MPNYKLKIEEVSEEECITCESDDCFNLATKFVEGFFYCNECAKNALEKFEEVHNARR